MNTLLHKDMTLNQVLTAIGWRHERGAHGRHQVWCSAGHLLGHLTAGDAWQELRARGIVTWVTSPRPDWQPRHLCACVGLMQVVTFEPITEISTEEEPKTRSLIGVASALPRFDGGVGS